MIRTLTIENFRCFEQFELHDLGRVNLLVGGNNSGKTSVLEAVELLSANGDISVVGTCLERRGQVLYGSEQPRSPVRFDVKRLFRGHVVQQGSRFCLNCDINGKPLQLIAEIVESDGREVFTPTALFDDLGQPDEPGQPLAFQIRWGDHSNSIHRSAFHKQGGVPAHKLISSGKRVGGDQIPTTYLPPLSLQAEQIIALFERIVLTSEEDTVLNTLRIIEPSVERLATHRTDDSISRGLRAGHRSGVLLRLQGVSERIPLGSMGDGVWRLLGLALCLVRAKNGILLVDDIDTGLHYSVMEKMWKLVAETAKRLNIQVFATTHSRDCVESLASVCRENVTANSEVTVQRIERGKKRSVAYTEREIVIAAEHGMEVR